MKFAYVHNCTRMIWIAVSVVSIYTALYTSLINHLKYFYPPCTCAFTIYVVSVPQKHNTIIRNSVILRQTSVNIYESIKEVLLNFLFDNIIEYYWLERVSNFRHTSVFKYKFLLIQITHRNERMPLPIKHSNDQPYILLQEEMHKKH